MNQEETKMLINVLNADAATSTHAEKMCGQTNKQTDKLESPLVKGIVARV